MHQTQQRLKELEAQGHEPVAIVAMSCRYPGGVQTPEDLWKLLCEGTDAVSVFPAERGWDLDALYDPDPDARGKSYVREGGFLRAAGHFDPAFFGISPREALTIDPQQRLLLETSWEAIERAGIDPGSLQGSATGVFIGIIDQGYAGSLLQAPDALEGHIGTGTTCSVASGRIAYTLGLEGPAVSVDTACSASLVALHLACQALRLGECTLALAGGVTLMATPSSFIEFSRQRALSEDGRCRAFSAQASGTGWAEGVGMLLLERLSDARRLGHPVLAVVRGSAVNQDGKSQGLTAPNGPAQERVIRQALDGARLSPADVDVVEAHGTGTPLGDPIEARALLATYGQARPAERPLWLGSIKSNLGHTQAAAGVAGVIKMVLALQHGLLPRTLHAEAPSAHVDWTSGNVRLLNEAVPWVAKGRPRRAGVSSFGISGTNAHVVLEEAPSGRAEGQSTAVASIPESLPVLLSGKTEFALRAQAERLGIYLGEQPDLALLDVAGALATTRSHFEHRAVVLAQGRGALLEALSVLASGTRVPESSIRAARSRGKLALLFTGQGSQYLGMGHALRETFPIFREAFDAACTLLDARLDRPLRDVMFARGGSADATWLDQTAFTQPAIFALEVALFRLLEAWGVRPDVLLGHSVGELSAAHLAGVLSLDDACALVAARARLMQGLPAGGAMVSLQATEEEVRAQLVGRNERVDIAALNGPLSTVISGDDDGVLTIAEHFEKLGRATKRLQVSHAFHSPRMAGMLEAFEREASRLAFHPPRIPIISNVTGRPASDEELTSPAYWARHARQAVRFSEGVRALENQGVTTFLELGPRGVLCAMTELCLSDDARSRAAFLPALSDDRAEVDTLLTALGHLHARGHALDWHAFFAPLGPRPVQLPTYAFQRQRYWPEVPSAQRTGESAARQAAGEVSSSPGDHLTVGESRPESTKRTDAATDKASLHRVEWSPLPELSEAPRTGRIALLGADPSRLGTALATEAGQVEHHRDLAALRTSLDQGAALPEIVLAPWVTVDANRIEAAHTASREGLALLQAWLTDERLVSSRLALVTRRAVAAGPSEDVLDLAAAPLWGLVRSAQSEHPERRIVLVDIDHRDASLRALPGAIVTGEPQLAVREGELLVPRLARTSVVPGMARQRWDPEGTVLITGGASPLASVIARHLVRKHGVRSLVLASRKGRAAPGAEALERELTEAGSQVTVVSCDVAKRHDLENVLASIPANRPLRGVVHAAAALDDGSLLALTPERLDEVLRPKVDGAFHLHELTKDLDVSTFVLFSSLAGVIGGPGQSNYAAANTFLDALAHHRRAQGKPCTSLAWGPWARGEDVNAHLGSADLAQLGRLGVAAIATEQGLALLDAALDLPDPCFVPAHLDRSTLDGQARWLPAILRELIAVGEVRAPSEEGALSALQERLAPLSRVDRSRALTELVRSRVAAVLGLSSPGDIDPERPLRELGLDSLMGLNLRNSLEALTGLRLPATLLFEQPTVAALVQRLREGLFGAEPEVAFDTTEPTTRTEEDPIAIVAMSCRYPGGVQTPEELWKLLVDGVDAISPFPRERGWDVDALHDPDPSARGKTYVREGGFLHDAARFDPAFFGISPREALAIDPQQRLLLEASWEAIERAGIDPVSLHGSRTGVFVGMSFQDYGARVIEVPADLEGYLGLGSTASIASGRIAYALELEGPAVTIDTACSSSLVSLHLACQALRQGECSLALAGGVCLMATPAAFIEFSRLRALSLDGRCKAFSADADGAGFAEGLGMLLLERLSDATRHGHPVLAVIRGSAVNQDGKSQGLTAPNGAAQERVIRQALASARLGLQEIDAIEAHGTGTALGDPIEAQALLATYGQGRQAQQPLWLGSIKSNLGHTQAAAGVAGVIKMVLALHHQVLPRTLHAEVPSSHVDWSPGTIRLLTEAVPWLPSERPRRAGVSSFGISGTNAHLILEEPPLSEGASLAASQPPSTASVTGDVPPVAEEASIPTSLPAWPLLLSGKTEAALYAQAGRLRDHLQAHPHLPLGDVAFSLATTRSHFDHRAALLLHDRDTALHALASLAQGSTPPQAVLGLASSAGKLALLFTGQGSQRIAMGRPLYRAFPLFRDAFDAVCLHLDPLLDRPLLDVLFADEDAPHAALLDQTAFTQPALFALEVALFRLLEAFGLAPDLLLGHSIGEIVAAHVASVLSLKDACALVAARARLMQALPPGGAMLALHASEQELLPLLAGREHLLAIAALNGPCASVLSGDPHAVADVAAHFQALGRKVTPLRVSHAFHSPHLDPILDAFRTVAASLSFHPPRIPLLSNLSGNLASNHDLASPDYWVRHARHTVRFLDAVRTLEAEGASTFLELGPHGVLCAMAQDGLSEHARARSAFLPVLRNDRDDRHALLLALAGLHARGHHLHWSSVFAPFHPRRVSLPTYPFQRDRYWLDAGKRPTPDDAVKAPSRNAGSSDATPPVPALYQLTWTATPSAPSSPPRRHCAVLGTLDDDLRAALASGNLEVDRYADFEALEAALDRGSPLPLTVIAPLVSPQGDPVETTHTVAQAGLALLQAWLKETRLGSSRLALVTRRAVAAQPGEGIADLGAATLWGLLRSAQTEHPDRSLLLVDVDTHATSHHTLHAALETGEPQLAVREGRLLVPQLAPVFVPNRAVADKLKPEGTVLVLGGTGGLGSQIARHLVTEHDVRHLLLASRQGRAAEGAETLEAELTKMGASVTLAACDAADGDALKALLASVPPAHPLTGVIHAAGVLDDGLLATMLPEQLTRALKPKVDAAFHLHELTRTLDLSLFVLFSSLAGVLGGPGQANYAAANALLDALAHRRKAEGLPAMALAWGPWAAPGSMTASLTDADRARLARHGIFPLAPGEGLSLFDTALGSPEGSLVAARLAPSPRAAEERQNGAPPMQRGLPQAVIDARGATTPSTLRERLADLPEAERDRVVISLVRDEVATVLGLTSRGALKPDQSLHTLGIDSLTALELRNRLAAITGLRLTPTLLYDHPTPMAVARYLRTALLPDGKAMAIHALGEIDRQLTVLASVGAIEDLRGDLMGRLEALLAKLTGPLQGTSGAPPSEALQSASDDELFDLIDRELGTHGDRHDE
uniref:TugB n=1 Tax=Chondromyces crocatus TaxID=52 RepID=D7P612_CHOCO|nr:TugB [Chondromyces crocatus]